MRFQICCVAVAEIKSIQISFLENSQCHHFCLDSAVDLDAKNRRNILVNWFCGKLSFPVELCCKRSANDSYLLCKWRRGEARKPFSILISYNLG